MYAGDGGPDRIRTGDLQRDRLACWAATPRVQLRRGRSIAEAPAVVAGQSALSELEDVELVGGVDAPAEDGSDLGEHRVGLAGPIEVRPLVDQDDPPDPGLGRHPAGTERARHRSQRHGRHPVLEVEALHHQRVRAPRELRHRGTRRGVAGDDHRPVRRVDPVGERIEPRLDVLGAGRRDAPAVALDDGAGRDVTDPDPRRPARRGSSPLDEGIHTQRGLDPGDPVVRKGSVAPVEQPSGKRHRRAGPWTDNTGSPPTDWSQRESRKHG